MAESPDDLDGGTYRRLHIGAAARLDDIEPSIGLVLYQWRSFCFPRQQGVDAYGRKDDKHCQQMPPYLLGMSGSHSSLLGVIEENAPRPCGHCRVRHLP